MILDIRTLVFVLGVIHILQIAVFSFQYWINKNHQGTGWWLLWGIAEVMGFGCMLAREIPPIRVLAITGQNTFIILGVIFLYIGIMRFFGQKKGHKIAILIFALYFAAFSHFLFVNDDIVTRGAVICATLAIISFLSAHALFVHRPAPVAIAANVTGAVFVAHGFFFLFRAGVLLRQGAAFNAAPFIATPLNIATYLDALICSILWTFVLIVMINQRLNAEIKEAKEEIELIFNTSPDAAVISSLDNGKIIHINEGFTIHFGFSRADVQEKSSLELEIWADPDDRRRITGELEKTGIIENIEIPFRKKDGSVLSGLVSARIIKMNNLTRMISVIKDISERKRMEDQIRHMANHDALTDLPTLRLANDRLAMAMKEADRNKTAVAVMFLDLDAFKEVNDTFGHEAGDSVLREVARRLLACVRQTDTVARAGGDEFLIIAPGIHAPADASLIAEKVLSLISRPILFHGRQAVIGTSMGIALYPDDAGEAKQLINRADEAMYRIKKGNKNGYCFSHSLEDQAEPLSQHS